VIFKRHIFVQPLLIYAQRCMINNDTMGIGYRMNINVF